MNTKQLRYLLLSITLVLFTACGGGSGDSAQDKAIDKIVAYAQNNGNADVPIIQDYIDAGVIGVNEGNIADINEVVSSLTKEDVDTTEEIQALLDATGVSLEPAPTPVAQSYAPTPMPTPEPAPVPTPETTPPVITLSGSSTVETLQGDAYVDAGATATDNVDGSVAVTSTDNIDVNTLGSYTVTYSAEDNAGNTAQATRTVNIVAVPDTTVPEFSSPNTVTLYTVNTGDTTAITLVATDTSPVTYSISGTNSADFTVAENTGVVTFNVAPTTPNTSYTFDATATDSSTNARTETVTIYVSPYTRDDVNNIVTDHSTGLEWQDNESKQRDWLTAATYCTELDLAGPGWELPSKDVLWEIVDTTGITPTIDPIFQNKLPNPYRTSDEFDTSFAWIVNFSNGKKGWAAKSNISFYVRCVR